ncbi:hypothetical protein [Spongiactinospora rosea]|uniref:hypothetical protein n=1 Tax=Spongiactinospora rosea TaxID=2248750 RepID=UPI0018F5145E|nr:hypothetical protein [Spongiactinospora rosea]
MADLVNAWIHREYQRSAVMTANYLGKLERGVVRWPCAEYRAALRAVLGTETDHALGFRRHRQRRKSADTVSDVDRKDFLRTALGAAATVPLAEWAMPAQAADVPTTVGPTEIQGLKTVAETFLSWDHAYGGGLVRDAVAAQIRYSVALLEHATCPPPLRADLHVAAGWLGQVGAMMAFDSYAHDDARKMFRLALACAEEAGDWHLRAKVLSGMARQAIWVGDADSGLTLVELALVRSDRLTPAERAMLLSARARAQAKLGMVQDTLETIGRADEQFARIRPSEEMPWMRYYDAAQHAGDTGHALFDLAMRGRFAAEASDRLTMAVAGHTDAYVRSRAISGIKLASLTMATGDPVQAAQTGARAVTDAGTVRSRRAQDDMRELHRLSAPHGRKTPVAELCDRIKATIRT